MKGKRSIHLIGNAHIDPVWLWRWQEGYAEIKATFRSALDRMNEFPEFIFTSACAAYYKWIEENEPLMFGEIKKRVKEGRWVIVGGWWIQPDCNIPSGESFVRHGLYSQRYFKEKFGVVSKVGYNVDSFGHNGMLPQILSKSGMDYYIFMRPDNNENAEIPGIIFNWESVDGSRVIAFRIPTSYGGFWKKTEDTRPQELLKIIEADRIVKSKDIDIMNFYGVGNHGGGPTISTLHMLEELKDKLTDINLVMSSPNKYFEEVSSQNLNLPVYIGELQHHASGCYSAHSETKANNRKSEQRLLAAEKLNTLVYSLFSIDYPRERINKAWENVLFNQFHDIIGGCSIKEAYDDAREVYGEALNIGAELINSAAQRISWSIDTMGSEIKNRNKEKDWYLWEDNDKGVPLVVFNTLSWEVTAPVKVNRLIKGVTDEKGTPIEHQVVRGPQTNNKDKWNSLFIAEIPPLGFRVYWVYLTKVFEVQENGSQLQVFGLKMENDFVSVEIDKHTGFIKEFYDKINKINIFDGKAAVPIVIDEYECDTWAHGVYKFRNEIAKFGDAQVKIIEMGKLRTIIRSVNSYNQSVLQQDFILYRHKQDIEVHVKLDWREKHKMLKLSFPVNIKNPSIIYEIPYGHIHRPVDGEEEPGQQWVDIYGSITEHENVKYGLGILNDSKYSFDVKDSNIRMTIARGSIFADHFGERDDLCEYMDQGLQEFKYKIVPHNEEWKISKVVRTAHELNTLPIHIMETYHKGVLPLKFSGINISSESIIAEVFKRAEEGNGYILRCYEVFGEQAEVIIEIPMLNRKWKDTFTKCEIKTYFIPDDPDNDVMEKNLLEFKML